MTRSAEGKTGRVFVGDLSDENAMDLAGKLVSEFFVYTVRGPPGFAQFRRIQPLCSCTSLHGWHQRKHEALTAAWLCMSSTFLHGQPWLTHISACRYMCMASAEKT